MKFALTRLAVLLLVPAVGTLYAEDMIVQIPVASILNTRCVTTLTDGRLVPWQMGVDGGGKGNGYLTLAAALAVGDTDPHALPDAGRFAADARHPEIVLNYSNAEGVSNQVRYVRGIGEFTMGVPSTNYARLFMCFTSSEGPSALTFLLTYADASTETVEVRCPDYYAGLRPNDPVVFYVAKDLGKWGRNGKVSEKNHHNIDGIELHPAREKPLVAVKVSKTSEKGYLVFWGGTGIVSAPTQ